MKKNRTEIEKICQIWLDGSIKYHGFVSDNPDQFWRLKESTFIRDTLDSEGYVYEIAGNIAGFITIRGNHILELFVDDIHQKKGIGTSLIEVIQDMQDSLKINVYEKNKRAIHFYEKCGFTKRNGPYTEDKTGCMKWWMEWPKKT